MKKICLLLSLCATLAACDKKEEHATQASAPAPAATSAPAQPAAQPQQSAAAPQANASALPKECDDYVARVKACVAKSGAAASAQFEKSLELAQAQWNAVPDKSQLAPSCTAANEQFGQVASMLKCE
ncbi:hypothetical protein JVX91_04695 [Pseudomonas sp. PDNC002]|uniref:hypothetical protein n=1 Tax=Pseudomonas sp. PDNC002 TaxID=2811422 RepID=UPI0019625F88|nr:hypothetical protein [Pseudomonas sp. PDNC002]QRY80422.1 hypothetical protein JVX91_04695 [Pseudomonas sp. PDNC002]